MSDLRAHRGVFMTEALYWYALNEKEAASFDAHGFFFQVFLAFEIIVLKR
jgi:hypothetical protein